MSVQVSLRLDEQLVHRVDELVRRGAIKSRAAIVESALERELRRLLNEHEARIYAEQGEDPETEGMREWFWSRAQHGEADE